MSEAHPRRTPQGSPLSPLLSNILLDDLDKELERRGHTFCRYADDCNIYVGSEKAAVRVVESITRYLENKLRLKVNKNKSKVTKPSAAKFLGYSMTGHKIPRLKAAPGSVRRLKNHIKELLRKGRGRAIRRIIKELGPVITGWTQYYRLATAKNTFESLDEWLRRRLRCIIWRQWKKPKTRAHRLITLGLDAARAHTSAYNGRGPWWNAGASHMNAALPVRWFAKQGLVSFLVRHKSFIHLT